MTITDEYLELGGPIPDGWHFDASHGEYQLYADGKKFFTATEEVVRRTQKSPQELYGRLRGLIS